LNSSGLPSTSFRWCSREYKHMSKIAEQIKKISQSLSEPTWLLSWRAEKAGHAETLPAAIKYGISIHAVLPPNEVPFDQTADYHVDASKGLELYTWKEAIAQEEIVPILEGLMKSEFFPSATDHFSGIAQALFRSGIVAYVQPSLEEDGTPREESLHLDTLVPKGSSADIVVVIAKEGAKLSLTSALSGGEQTSVFARTVIVLTERDAHVRITQKHTLANGATALFSSRGIAAAHSSVTWSAIFAGAIAVKSGTENMLIGDEARGEIREGILGGGSAQFDVFSSAKHLADHTHSRIRAAGLATDTSRTVYRGLIDMVEGIRAVDGGQEARFLVLSPKAEVDAIPSLDIASKDVLSTHKLSISHIRDTDTFYSKLRGLSDEESKQLFLEGHFAQVFSTGASTECFNPEFSTEGLSRMSSRQGFPGEDNEPIMNDIRTALSGIRPV